MAVTEGPVREEQLLHDMCLLGAVTVEIAQILTRAGFTDVSISEPLLRQNPVLSCDEVQYIYTLRSTYDCRMQSYDTHTHTYAHLSQRPLIMVR